MGRHSLPCLKKISTPVRTCVDNSRYNEYYSGMSGRLSSEIKQSKPFPSVETEVFLNLTRTADHTMRIVTEVLKTADLSPTQYNVLRILQGAGKDGLPCSEIGSRMITRDPDITRLLDRMEQRELVARTRSSADRRVVTAKITKAGSEVLAKLERPVLESSKRHLAHMTEKQMRELIDLLELVRAGEA